MDDSANEERQQIIDGFVARLVRIRADAGDPSFRSMAKRSGAISHATLHDAVQGTRLPSWETTVEFAKTCGVDPEDLRAEWERADAIVHPQPNESEADDSEEDPAAVGQPESGSATASEGGHSGRSPSSRHKLAAVAVLVGAAVVVAGVVGVRQLADGSADSDDMAGRVSSPSSTPPSKNQVTYPPVPKDVVPTTTDSGGCPANVKEKLAQYTPRTAGDKGGFEDLGPDDCSVQKRGAQVIKKFKLTNKGTVTWHGRKLVRIERDGTNPGCRMPAEVMVPTIGPGESDIVEIDIIAPDKKGVCFARWMQLDADNQWAFPDQRPYYLSFKTK